LYYIRERQNVFTEEANGERRKAGRAAGVQEEGKDGMEPSTGEAGALD